MTEREVVELLQARLRALELALAQILEIADEVETETFESSAGRALGQIEKVASAALKL